MTDSTCFSLQLAARNLPKLDQIGWLDPYVVIENDDGTKICQTKRLKAQANPDWPSIRVPLDRLTLGMSHEEARGLHVMFRIYDYDFGKEDDYAGSVCVTMGDLFDAQEDRQPRSWVVDEQEDPTCTFILKNIESIENEMALESVELLDFPLKYNHHPSTLKQLAKVSQSDKLYVVLKFKSIDLVNTDVIGKSDPYLQIDSLGGKLIHRTEYLKNNLNPDWKAFSLSQTAICPNWHFKQLRLKVFDRDLIGSNDLIGQIETSSKVLIAAGRQRKQLTWRLYKKVNFESEDKRGRKVEQKLRGKLVLEYAILSKTPDVSSLRGLDEDFVFYERTGSIVDFLENDDDQKSPSLENPTETKTLRTDSLPAIPRVPKVQSQDDISIEVSPADEILENNIPEEEGIVISQLDVEKTRRRSSSIAVLHGNADDSTATNLKRSAAFSDRSKRKPSVVDRSQRKVSHALGPDITRNLLAVTIEEVSEGDRVNDCKVTFSDAVGRALDSIMDSDVGDQSDGSDSEGDGEAPMPLAASEENENHGSRRRKTAAGGGKMSSVIVNEYLEDSGLQPIPTPDSTTTSGINAIPVEKAGSTTGQTSAWFLDAVTNSEEIISDAEISSPFDTINVIHTDAPPGNSMATADTCNMDESGDVNSNADESAIKNSSENARVFILATGKPVSKQDVMPKFTGRKGAGGCNHLMEGFEVSGFQTSTCEESSNISATTEEVPATEVLTGANTCSPSDNAINSESEHRSAGKPEGSNYSTILADKEIASEQEPEDTYIMTGETNRDVADNENTNTCNNIVSMELEVNGATDASNTETTVGHSTGNTPEEITSGVLEFLEATGNNLYLDNGKKDRKISPKTDETPDNTKHVDIDVKEKLPTEAMDEISLSTLLTSSHITTTGQTDENATPQNEVSEISSARQDIECGDDKKEKSEKHQGTNAVDLCTGIHNSLATEVDEGDKGIRGNEAGNSDYLMNAPQLNEYSHKASESDESEDMENKHNSRMGKASWGEYGEENETVLLSSEGFTYSELPGVQVRGNSESGRLNRSVTDENYMSSSNVHNETMNEGGAEGTNGTELPGKLPDKLDADSRITGRQFNSLEVTDDTTCQESSSEVLFNSENKDVTSTPTDGTPVTETSDIGGNHSHNETSMEISYEFPSKEISFAGRTRGDGFEFQQTPITPKNTETDSVGTRENDKDVPVDISRKQVESNSEEKSTEEYSQSTHTIDNREINVDLDGIGTKNDNRNEEEVIFHGIVSGINFPNEDARHRSSPMVAIKEQDAMGERILENAGNRNPDPQDLTLVADTSCTPSEDLPLSHTLAVPSKDSEISLSDMEDYEMINEENKRVTEGSPNRITRDSDVSASLVKNGREIELEENWIESRERSPDVERLARNSRDKFREQSQMYKKASSEISVEVEEPEISPDEMPQVTGAFHGRNQKSINVESSHSGTGDRPTMQPDIEETTCIQDALQNKSPETPMSDLEESNKIFMDSQEDVEPARSQSYEEPRQILPEDRPAVIYSEKDRLSNSEPQNLTDEQKSHFSASESTCVQPVEEENSTSQSGKLGPACNTNVNESGSHLIDFTSTLATTTAEDSENHIQLDYSNSSISRKRNLQDETIQTYTSDFDHENPVAEKTPTSSKNILKSDLRHLEEVTHEIENVNENNDVRSSTTYKIRHESTEQGLMDDNDESVDEDLLESTDESPAFQGTPQSGRKDRLPDQNKSRLSKFGLSVEVDEPEICPDEMLEVSGAFRVHNKPKSKGTTKEDENTYTNEEYFTNYDKRQSTDRNKLSGMENNELTSDRDSISSDGDVCDDSAVEEIEILDGSIEDLQKESVSRLKNKKHYLLAALATVAAVAVAGTVYSRR